MDNYRIVTNYMQASVYLPEIQYFKHLKSSVHGTWFLQSNHIQRSTGQAESFARKI